MAMSEDTNHASDLVLLPASCVRLFRSASDSATVRVTVENAPRLSPDRSYLRVKIARAFPLSKPDRYIGLRDGNDKDIGLLQTLEGIDDTSRKIISEELDRRYFMPVWQRTVRIKEEYGVVEWEMMTDRGLRTFHLRNIKDSVQHLTATRVLVSDTDGSRFEVTDTDALEPKSYDVLSKAL